MPIHADIQVLPVEPKNARAKFAAETGWMLHRLDAFEKSRAVAGWTIERVALMQVPAASFTIAYHESTKTPEESERILRTSEEVFDRDRRMRGAVLHGMDDATQLKNRVARELVIDAGVIPARREPWQAFAAAIQPGKTDAWRALGRTLAGARRSDFVAFNEQNGYVVHRAALYQSPAGDFACFYLEGRDPAGLPAALAGSEFGRWYADEAAVLLGADLRKGLPIVPVGICWDWVVGQPTEPVAPLYARSIALMGG